MRIVRPDGVVSGPLAGVPDVKSVAAQGLHDVVLDPQFATNRLLYFTYFAPPKGEAPAVWPIEFFYERVWTRPLAERRTMQLGAERVARARLSDDSRSLEKVEVLAEGAERRIVIGARREPLRHRCRSVPLLRYRSRRRRARVHRQSGHPAQLLRARAPHRPRWIDPEGQPVAQPRHRAGRDVRARLQGSRRCGAASADRRAVDDRPRAAGRRRGQHRAGRQGLRLAGCLIRSAVRRATGRTGARTWSWALARLP